MKYSFTIKIITITDVSIQKFNCTSSYEVDSRCSEIRMKYAKKINNVEYYVGPDYYQITVVISDF